MQTFKKLLFLLSPHERRQAYLLFIMMITVALTDMLGVASIEANNILRTLFQASSRFGVDNKQDFLFFLGLLVFMLLITSLTLKAIVTYAQARFVFMREYSICSRLVKGYLYHPFSWFLSRNSADLGKTILSEVTQVIASGMNPLMELIAKGFITITLIALLVLVDIKLALTVGLLIGFAYLIIFYFVRKSLSQIGEQRLKNNQLRFTTVGEAFGAIKEVKVRNLEEFYIENFSKSAKIYAKSFASSQVISQLPRFILEAIAFGGILLILPINTCLTTNLQILCSTNLY